MSCSGTRVARPRRRRHGRLPGTIAAVMLLGACGGAGAPSGAAGLPAGADAAHVSQWDADAMPDPCRTVPASDLGRVLGRQVGPGVRLDSWPPLCRIALDDDRLGLLAADDSRPGALVAFDQARSGPGGVLAVAGVGDEAFWSDEYRTLHVRLRAAYLKVLFSGPGGPSGAPAREQAVAVARVALGRLP